MNYTLHSISSYLFLTFTYSILSTILKSKKHVLYLFCAFFALVIFSQCAFASQVISGKCTTDPNNPHYDFYPVFFHCFLPWFFIFGVIAIMLEGFPASLGPFSNTFGFITVKLMGVSSLIKKLLKSDFYSKATVRDSGIKALSDAIHDIRDKDDSLFINLFTSRNFDANMETYDNMFNKSDMNIFRANVESFRHLVKIKETVSKTIWYILAGFLSSSITSLKLTSWKCKRSLKELTKLNDKRKR